MKSATVKLLAALMAGVAALAMTTTAQAQISYSVDYPSTTAAIGYSMPRVTTYYRAPTVVRYAPYATYRGYTTPTVTARYATPSVTYGSPSYYAAPRYSTYYAPYTSSYRPYGYSTSAYVSPYGPTGAYSYFSPYGGTEVRVPGQPIRNVLRALVP